MLHSSARWPPPTTAACAISIRPPAMAPAARKNCSAASSPIERDTVFLASKANPPELTAASMYGMVEESLKRLATDRIDLYYIHWPRAGRDMRPVMEGLEQARREGRIGAIGVSNFSVDQMRQVEEVAPIAVHQLGYNLLWRHTEREIIPYCRERGIAVVAYSALAHGILTGKYGREPALAPGDQRHTILPFRADIWPHVHAGVEKLKGLAGELGVPLPALAIRWILQRPGIETVVVGARNCRAGFRQRCGSGACHPGRRVCSDDRDQRRGCRACPRRRQPLQPLSLAAVWACEKAASALAASMDHAGAVCATAPARDRSSGLNRPGRPSRSPPRPRHRRSA